MFLTDLAKIQFCKRHDSLEIPMTKFFIFHKEVNGKDFKSVTAVMNFV